MTNTENLQTIAIVTRAYVAAVQYREETANALSALLISDEGSAVWHLARRANLDAWGMLGAAQWNMENAFAGAGASLGLSDIGSVL